MAATVRGSLSHVGGGASQKGARIMGRVTWTDDELQGLLERLRQVAALSGAAREHEWNELSHSFLIGEVCCQTLAPSWVMVAW